MRILRVIRSRIKASSAISTTSGVWPSSNTASIAEIVPSNTVRWLVSGPTDTTSRLPKSTTPPSSQIIRSCGPVAPVPVAKRCSRSVRSPSTPSSISRRTQSRAMLGTR